jgi:hypothetical protein
MTNPEFLKAVAEIVGLSAGLSREPGNGGDAYILYVLPDGAIEFSDK